MPKPAADYLLIAGVLVSLAAASAVLSLTLGRRIAQRRPALAVLACGLAIPAGVAAGGWLQYAVTRHDPGDMPAMALAGVLFFAVVSAPIGVLVALLLLRRR